MGVLSATVATVVGAAAAVAGGGICAAPVVGTTLPSGPRDQVCFQLVRTLALRTGILAGVATAILVLTTVGLTRLSRTPRLPGAGGSLGE